MPTPDPRAVPCERSAMPSCRPCLPARCCADVHALPMASVDAQDLYRLVSRWAEPVRQPRVELGDLARSHREVVFADDQPDLSGEHIEPLVALVCPQFAFALGWDDDLPDLQAPRLLGEGEDHAAVARARLQPDTRVADLRCADQLVERHLMGFG